MYEWQNRGTTKRRVPAENKPNAFVKNRVDRYLRQTGNGKKAYDAHEGRKVLLRYEDLKADASETMRQLYSALNIPTAEARLARVIEKHAWENLPEEEKGEGKLYRKATPGGWREDLTSTQARTIEEITSPLLREFYP